jgi:serine/threonine-protein kinase
VEVKGTEVILTLSGGPEMVKVPNIVGMAQDRAIDALREAGLFASISTIETTSAADLGKVYSCLPGQGETVKKGSTVVISVFIAAPIPPEPPEPPPPVTTP